MVSAIKKRKLPDSSKVKNRTSSNLKEDQKKVQQNGIAKSKGKVKERKKSPHYVKGFLFTVITLVVVALLIYHRFDSISRLYAGIKVSRSEGAETEFNNIDDTNRLYLRRGIDKRFNLSLDEFIKLYDAKWPVLITDAMKNWKAMTKWTKDFFIHNYGDKKIAFKGVSGPFYNRDNRQGLATNLAVYLDHIHEASPNVWTYLEDEIFLMRNAKLREDLGVPIYLKEDFFSLFPEEVRPWNAMLLWGTKFSRSTLHIDPYNWTGTNAVIKGKKRWKLYPPGQDHLLYVQPGSRCGFPLDCQKYQSIADTFDMETDKFPLLKKAKVVEFEQHPGEFLIIPTGWFHQGGRKTKKAIKAFNDEETLAVSSQVMNSQNYRQVLEEIIKVGNIRQKDIPSDLSSLSPKDQVAGVMTLLPKRILERGKKVTKDIIQQMERGSRLPKEK